jgi:hypothetical protein
MDEWDRLAAAIADAEFRESDHPRGGNPENPGQFSKGGGGEVKTESRLSGSGPGGTAATPEEQRILDDKVYAAFARRTFGQKLTSSTAADYTIASMRAEFTPGRDIDIKSALEKAGITEKNVASKTDGDLSEIVRNAGVGTRGGWGRDYLNVSEIISEITEKEDQERVVDAWVSMAGSRNASAMMFYNAEAMTRTFRGDVLDRAADTADPKILSGIGGNLKMFSKDYGLFKVGFIGTWLSTGGTTAHRRAYAAMKKQDGNTGHDFWMGETPLGAGEKVPSANMRANLVKLHEETQEFYRNKLKTRANPSPDLDSMTIDVVRGVGKANFDEYTPAPVESWTVDRKTAIRFAKGMDHGRGSSILSAKIPVSSILMSWEAQKESGWAPENELAGKKEVVAFGGALRDLNVTTVSGPKGRG